MRRSLFERITTHAALWLCLWGMLGCSAAESDDDTGMSDCRVRHPLVLSHHWGMRRICPVGEDPEVCREREPERYSARDDDGAWTFRVPESELDLPPRNHNVHDDGLQRDLAAYHRYFSKEVVERLRGCGNEVYLSDKPPFASYAVRARSLKNTVLQALQESGADQVILVGMSQGVQDARWLVGTDPEIRRRVAAVVGLAGEDQGAGAASYYFETRAALLGTDWDDPSGDFLWDGTRQQPDNQPDDNYALAMQGLWHTADEVPVLIENYDRDNPAEYGLDETQLYRHMTASLAVLTRKYMRGDEPPGHDGWLGAWDDLVELTGIGEGFTHFVTEGAERDNGVRYLSFGAQVQRWDEQAWGGGFDRAPFDAMQALGEPNDGYTSVASQSFETRRGADGEPYPNFTHVLTLDGDVGARGYHHMFFSGRNDALYAPTTDLRGPQPHGASSADFFEQVMVDLRVEGL